MRESSIPSAVEAIGFRWRAIGACAKVSIAVGDSTAMREPAVNLGGDWVQSDDRSKDEIHKVPGI